MVGSSFDPLTMGSAAKRIPISKGTGLPKRVPGAYVCVLQEQYKLRNFLSFLSEIRQTQARGGLVAAALFQGHGDEDDYRHDVGEHLE